MRFALALLLLSSCTRSLPEIRDLDAFQIELTAATPLAAVRGDGCFRVTGTGLTSATRARVGGVEAESISSSGGSDLYVCPAETTPLGAQTLEVGTAVELATLPSQVTVVDPLEPGRVEPQHRRVAWGDVLTITGRGWDSVLASNHVVTFTGANGQVTAEVTQASAEQIAVTVPDSAVTGSVEVALGSVSPDSTSVTLQPVTVIQAFDFDVIPVRPEGAYAGEVVELQLSSGIAGAGAITAEEIAVDGFQVLIDGLPAEAYVSLTDATRLAVRLPDDLQPGETEICVQGDVSQPCTLGGFGLRILGPGHTDLLRPPSCATLNPTGGVDAVALPYPTRFHEGAEREINWVFALSNEANAIFQISTNDNFASTVLPLPVSVVGQYQGLVANIGCDTVSVDNCLSAGSLGSVAPTGWIATVRSQPTSDVVVYYGFGDDGFANETNLSGAQVDHLLPVDNNRLGLVATQGGVSRAGSLGRADNTIDDWVSLGGRLIDMTTIDRPGPSDVPTWPHYVTAVDDGGTTRFAHVDFTDPVSAVPAGSPPGVASPRPLSGRMSWIVGADALVMAEGGFAQLVLFDGATPTWTGVHAVIEVVAEDVCGGCMADPSPLSSTAVSRPTWFGGREGHWIIHSTHLSGSATAVAFVPLFTSPFWDSVGSTLTLPRWDFDGVGVDGAIIYDAPLGSWWLAESFDPFIPRQALVRADDTLGCITLPYRDEPGGVPYPPRYQTVLSGDDTPTIWGAGHGSTWSAFHRDGYLVHINSTLGTATTSPLPLLEEAEVVVWPQRDDFGLQIAHGYQGDSRAQILLDNTGSQVSGFGVVARGAPSIDEGGTEVSVESVEAVLAVTPATDAQTHMHSNWAGRLDLMLQGPNGYQCPMTTGYALSRTLAGDQRLVVEACEVVTAAPCSELADCPGCTGIHPDARLAYWQTDLAADSTGFEMDMCAPGARVIGALPRPDTSEYLILWSVDMLTDLGGGDAAFTFASIVSFDGGFQNLTGERLNMVGRTEWPVTTAGAAIRLIGGGYNPKRERWAFALEFPSGTSTFTGNTAIFNLDPNTMAVAGVPVPSGDPVGAFVGSPDGARVYVLVSHELSSEVFIFRTGNIPELMGVTGLPSSATSMAISRAGGTLVAGMGDGYCVLSD